MSEAETIDEEKIALPEHQYSWSAKPLKPIYSPYHDDLSEPFIYRYNLPDGTPRTLTKTDVKYFHEGTEPESEVDYLRRRLGSLPHWLRRQHAGKLSSLEEKDKKFADLWLVKTFKPHVLHRVDSINAKYQPLDNLHLALLPLVDQFFRLLWSGKKEIKQLSYSLAGVMAGEFMRKTDFLLKQTGDPVNASLGGYAHIAGIAKTVSSGIPGWSAYQQRGLTAEDALRAVARLESPKWWTGRLKKNHDQWREHLMIACGYVHKKINAYCSFPCLQEWQAKKKDNAEFLKEMELEDQETGDRISLIDVVRRSNANPSLRRCELMVRLSGFDALAKAQSLTGFFYTLTAPSCYHSILHNGRRNHRYNHASPRDTQKYLCGVWARTRAAWKRQGIRVFGMRIAEPHHDGTPHWHLFLYMRPDHAKQANDIFRKYALEQDGKEPGARKHRLIAKAIDKDKVSGAAYLAKYIAKNIDGFGLGSEADHETGKEVSEGTYSVLAWASRWRIRQFQQIGGAPVTVYRELRKLRDPKIELHPDITPVHDAANGGRWGDYVSAQGGPLVERANLRVRLSYAVTENANDYGDDVSKITGVYSPLAGQESLACTRLKKYKIVPKLETAGEGEALPGASSGFDVDVKGGYATPRSTVNNCTPFPNSDEKNTAIADAIKVDFDNLEPKERRDLRYRLLTTVKKRRKPDKATNLVDTSDPESLQVKHHQELLSVKGYKITDFETRSLMGGSKMIAEDGKTIRILNGRVNVEFDSKANQSPPVKVSIKNKVGGMIEKWKRAIQASEKY